MRLADLDGKLSTTEGIRLAELAQNVRVDCAIVELGSYKGKSACYLGVGSRYGQGASVYAVDLWETHLWLGYSSPRVFSAWCEQVSQMELLEVVTPIRCDSAVLGKLFSQPVGLLFIDGDHGFPSVKADFHAWSSKLVDDGVLVFHDYGNEEYGAGVRKFVEEHIVASEVWSDLELIDSMCIVRRLKQEELDESRLTYVENRELVNQLARRPPQYAFELASIIPKRDASGVYVDTHSPLYEPLVRKYRDAKAAMPVEVRVDSICQSCPIGAMCRFPRLAAHERREILKSEDRAKWRNWCESKAWGQAMDVVYPYVASEARGDELKFSIRSVEANYLGTPRFWLIGDRPAWYRGNFIPHQRLAARKHRPRLDRASKLWRIIKEKAVENEFLWMMDDVYFLQPVVLDELRRRWFGEPMNAERLADYEVTNEYMEEKHMTWKALAANGRPIDDLATHFPYYYEKDKLRKLFRKYKLLQNPFVDSLLYLNEYATYLPRHCSEIQYREVGHPSADEIRLRMRSALLMNHASFAYTPAMEEVLAELFPHASSVEG